MQKIEQFMTWTDFTTYEGIHFEKLSILFESKLTEVNPLTNRPL